MGSIINVTSKAVAYSDSGTSALPARKHFDWTRTIVAEILNPNSVQRTIPVGSTYTFFNGTQSTTIDGTTAFTVTQSPLRLDLYRFTATAGAVPNFRTDRALTLTGNSVTVVVNSDLTATFNLSGGTWAGVTVGDTVFIPGPITGDSASPFSAANQGFWSVIAVISPTSLQVQRTGQFNGTGEVVPVTVNSQIAAFTPGGVQVGDRVFISSGFSIQTLGFYVIEQVTPTWFEVRSTIALPLEVGKIPTATGMVFYTNAKKFLRIESDQRVSVRLNGATDDRLWIDPVEPGDTELPGWHESYGKAYSLVIVNYSTSPAVVTVISGE